MGGVGSGNTRRDYRRGRHKADSIETKLNRNRVSFIVRIEKSLLTKFRVLALEADVTANTLIVDYIKRTVKKSHTGE